MPGAREPRDAADRRAEKSEPGKHQAAQRPEGDPGDVVRSRSEDPGPARPLPRFDRRNPEWQTAVRSRALQGRHWAGHRRTALREPENLRSDFKRRDGAERLPARREAQRFLRRRETLLRFRGRPVRLQHDCAHRVDAGIARHPSLDFAPPARGAANLAKLQIPSSREAPIIKHQLAASWSFNVWNFSGAWMFELGAFLSRQRRLIIALQQIRRVAKDRDRAFVAQSLFGKPAAKNTDDWQVDFLRRFDVVRRIADRDRVAG